MIKKLITLLKLGRKIEDVKDVNDAVVRFGVAETLKQIHQNAERSKIKIEMFKKRIQRKINE